MKKVFSIVAVLSGIFVIVILVGRKLADNPVISVDPALHYVGKAAKKKSVKKKGMYIYELKEWLYRPVVKKMLRASRREKSMVFYSLRGAKDFSASATGTDLKHHIVNSYLVGYSPFYTKNTWIPWQTLAKKKTYQTDHVTYKGRPDVWQTSKQAYRLTRGDCEDHAIALADWLISMGDDARVVVGTYKGGGHAWVVLLKDGKEFILEATQKSGLQTMIRFPLAKQMPGYRPSYMFNRKYFWKNTGSRATSDYSSSKWIKKSRFNLGYSI